MRIAIDCADLDHTRIDGTRVYIKNILNWLGKIDRESQFFLYHQKDFNPMLAPKMYDNYVERKIPYPFWWTQTRLPYEIMRDKPAILWMPIQQLPYLLKGKVKSVITIHDLAFKIFPDHFTFSDRFKLNLFSDYAVKNADKIIAVSESTKKDILKFYPKIDEKKVKVIHHGIERGGNEKDIHLPNLPGNLGKPRTAMVLGRLTNFLLYVGAIQPRKNLIVLVEAFEKIKRKNKFEDLKLVIVGEPAWMAEKILARMKESVFSKDIILTGKLGFEETKRLYEKAKIFVFPSLYEGFGIPVLEAWSAGTAVIVANNSSLEEIGKNAVEKFDEKSSDELVEKIDLLLSDENYRMELAERGQRELENYSWEKSARETLEFLKTS